MKPRRAIKPTTRDETGALIIGDPDKGCIWCDAPAELTYSGCGTIAWWHAPIACCETRTKRQARSEAYASSTPSNLRPS